MVYLTCVIIARIYPKSQEYHYFLTVDLKESNVRLKLTVVDTVGYGDQINKDDRYNKYEI